MRTAIALSVVCAAIFVLAGCGPKIYSDQVVSIDLKALSDDAAACMTVCVDDEAVFGPYAKLAPGESQTLVVHDPDAKPQKNCQHDITYTFDRRALDSGHAEIAVKVGEDKVMVDNSRFVWLGCWATQTFYYRLADKD